MPATTVLLSLVWKAESKVKVQFGDLAQALCSHGTHSSQPPVGHLGVGRPSPFQPVPRNEHKGLPGLHYGTFDRAMCSFCLWLCLDV